MTRKMRAISQQSRGEPGVLTEVEVDRPTPRPVEVLVRVHTAGVNAADWEARADAAPIDDIADRWIVRYHRRRSQALADLKVALEDGAMSETSRNPI